MKRKARKREPGPAEKVLGPEGRRLDEARADPPPMSGAETSADVPDGPAEAVRSEKMALWPPAGEKNQRIALKAILAIEEDHRPGRSKDQILAMIDTLKQHGQQVPICVAIVPGGFQMVDGETRRQAALKLAWSDILADVYPPMSDAAMHALRAVLNLDRLGTTPVDECLAVLSTLRAITGKREFGQGMTAEGSVTVLPPEVAAVAAALGRSERWVRDRLVLARLSSPVRDLVAAGRLSLGHAREIAKVADFAVQNDLAERFALDEDGSGQVWDLGDVRAAIEDARRAIRGTRWDPGVAYAGMPSCVECPHNTAAVNRLFADETSIEEGCCMCAGCYQHKTDAAERDLEKAVKAAVKARAPATVAGIRKFVPNGLKPAAVARQVEKQTGTGNGERGTGKGKRQPERERTPEEKLASARGTWSEKLRNQIVQATRKAFGKDRKRWAAWNLARHILEVQKLDAYGVRGPEKLAGRWRAARVTLKAVVDGKADLEALAVKGDLGEANGNFFWFLMHWPDIALTEFAGLLGVEAAAPPTLKDFTAENAEDAEKKTGGKKKKAEKAKEAADPDCDHDCETCKVEDCESGD